MGVLIKSFDVCHPFRKLSTNRYVTSLYIKFLQWIIYFDSEDGLNGRIYKVDIVCENLSVKEIGASKE